MSPHCALCVLDQIQLIFCFFCSFYLFLCTVELLLVLLAQIQLNIRALLVVFTIQKTRGAELCIRCYHACCKMVTELDY